MSFYRSIQKREANKNSSSVTSEPPNPYSPFSYAYNLGICVWSSLVSSLVASGSILAMLAVGECSCIHRKSLTFKL